MTVVTGKKEFTVEFVSGVLTDAGLLTDAEVREVMIGADAQTARLKKTSESFYSSRLLQRVEDTVSPVEVIASLNIPLPGSPGKTITEDIITEAVAAHLNIPYLKIDPLKLDLDTVTSRIPRPFAQRLLVVPVGEDSESVTIAVADPFSTEPVESLKASIKKKIRPVLSSKADILKTIREFYGFRHAVGAAEKEFSSSWEIGNLEQYVKLKGAAEIEATDQHIVNAVEYLLHYAYEQRASDIHIEPKRENSLVRIRIDGVLHCIHTVPRVVHPSIVSRIKMLSRMDIAEKRRPQDGRIKTSFRDRDVELRVSTLPTAFGEKVVLRIFDPEILFQDVRELGFYDQEFEVFNSFLRKTHGIVLVTGPTGSGKTTTLYSALKHLSTPEVNIVTIEDPIEMIVEEFNQVGVQPQAGVDFAGSLRTILRQDPDIIMVGEIRDRPTADNAIQAALTGHLVFSTLHTNDAPSSVTRLVDLGVPRFLINSTIIGIVAQRLVRKICTQCRRERELTIDEAASLSLKPGAYRTWYGEGCSECRGTGFSGRAGVFEILDFNDEVRAIVAAEGGDAAVAACARKAGMMTLRQSAARKMLDGVTTYEEVVTVTA
jgi:general secretion pathway protein E